MKWVAMFAYLVDQGALPRPLVQHPEFARAGHSIPAAITAQGSVLPASPDASKALLRTSFLRNKGSLVVWREKGSPVVDDLPGLRHERLIVAGDGVVACPRRAVRVNSQPRKSPLPLQIDGGQGCQRASKRVA